MASGEVERAGDVELRAEADFQHAAVDEHVQLVTVGDFEDRVRRVVLDREAEHRREQRDAAEAVLADGAVDGGDRGRRRAG